MRRHLYLLALISSFCISPAMAGGGGMTGNGFPRHVPRYENLSAMPSKWSVFETLRRVGTTFPTLTLVMQETIENLEAGGPGFQLLRSRARHPDFHAQSWGTPPPGLPTSATVLFWDTYFGLTRNVRSKVVIHELVHLVLAGNDEQKAEELTDQILNLAYGTDMQKFEAKTILAPYVKSFPLIQYDMTASRAHLMTNLRRDAFGWRGACSGFRTIELATLPTKTLRIEIASLEISQHLHQDPYFIYLRELCLSGLMTYSQRGPIEVFFSEPALRSAFLTDIASVPLSSGETIDLAQLPTVGPIFAGWRKHYLTQYSDHEFQAEYALPEGLSVLPGLKVRFVP